MATSLSLFLKVGNRWPPTLSQRSHAHSKSDSMLSIQNLTFKTSVFILTLHIHAQTRILRLKIRTTRRTISKIGFFSLRAKAVSDSFNTTCHDERIDFSRDRLPNRWRILLGTSEKTRSSEADKSRLSSRGRNKLTGDRYRARAREREKERESNCYNKRTILE